MDADRPPVCTDLDEDCDTLDHLHCYLYDPAKGRCPFLGKPGDVQAAREVLLRDAEG